MCTRTVFNIDRDGNSYTYSVSAYCEVEYAGGKDGHYTELDEGDHWRHYYGKPPPDDGKPIWKVRLIGKWNGGDVSSPWCDEQFEAVRLAMAQWNRL